MLLDFKQQLRSQMKNDKIYCQVNIFDMPYFYMYAYYEQCVLLKHLENNVKFYDYKSTL